MSIIRSILGFLFNRRPATGPSAPLRPNFIGTLGDFQQPPPFFFKDVTIYDYEIAADRNVLKALCDTYINIGPENGWRPFYSSVFVQASRYGEMRGGHGGAGFAKQNELTFAIFLYRPPMDFAWFAPFLIVDNPLSLISGREVSGFPKAWGEFTPGASAPWPPAVVSTWAFADPSPASELRSRPLLTIEPPVEQPAPDDPPGLSSLTNWPFGIMMRKEVLEIVAQHNPEAQSHMSASALSGGLTVGMRQFREFRDYQHLTQASYHGLNDGIYVYKNISAGGPLADPKIMLNSYPGLDIKGTLGMETHDQGPLTGSLKVVNSRWAALDFDLTTPLVIHSEH